MKVLTCEKCGSTDLVKEKGYYICQYCGARHLITEEDRPAKYSTIELGDDVSKLLEKCRKDPARAAKYAQLILEIDPNNSEAKKYLGLSTSSTSSGGCYIATAIYGSYDCPQVWTLRRYRDFTLSKTWYGRLFINLYYSTSPVLVKLFGDAQWFRRLWKPLLDKMVKRLNEEGVIDTPYQDSE